MPALASFDINYVFAPRTRKYGCPRCGDCETAGRRFTHATGSPPIPYDAANEDLLMDWKRALTQNHATLEPDSAEPLLRPLDLPDSPKEIANQIERWAEQQPRWSVESRHDSDSAVELHLTRSTRVMRFVDDVRLRIAWEGNSSRIVAESRSRIGKGDLGQNARNLKELTGPLRRDQ